jgi:hypothetical protein
MKLTTGITLDKKRLLRISVTNGLTRNYPNVTASYDSVMVPLDVCVKGQSVVCKLEAEHVTY